MRGSTPFERGLREIHGDDVLEGGPGESGTFRTAAPRSQFSKLPLYGKIGVFPLAIFLLLLLIALAGFGAFVVWAMFTAWFSPTAGVIGAAIFLMVACVLVPRLSR